MNPIFLKSYIERAIVSGAYLKIDYVDRKSKITKDRIIQPFTLKKKDGEYFAVQAQCYLRNDIRLFEFEGIQKCEVAKAEEILK